MLIQMHITGMVFSGPSTMIPMYVRFPYTKQDAICFLEQDIFTNVVSKMGMDMHSIFRLMLLRKMISSLTFMMRPLEEYPHFSSMLSSLYKTEQTNIPIIC